MASTAVCCRRFGTRQVTLELSSQASVRLCKTKYFVYLSLSINDLQQLLLHPLLSWHVVNVDFEYFHQNKEAPRWSLFVWHMEASRFVCVWPRLLAADVTWARAASPSVNYCLPLWEQLAFSVFLLLHPKCFYIKLADSRRFPLCRCSCWFSYIMNIRPLAIAA